MSALQDIRELPPSVLFTPFAPAGWDSALDKPESIIDLVPSFAKPEERVQEARAHLREVAAAIFADAVAEGMTPSEAVDLIIRDTKYLAARHEYAHWATESGLNKAGLLHAPAKKCFPIKLWSISSSIGRDLERGVQLENAKRWALQRLDDHPNAIEIPTSVSDEQRRNDPMWFLRDPLLPDPIIAGMLASHRQWALFPVVDCLARRSKWRLDLIGAAARLWCEESRAYLRLLSAFPAAEVSEDLVPAGDRFDVKSVIAKHRALIEALSTPAT